MRILLIEDETRIVAELSDCLSRAGYVVETASDGEEGWFRGETEEFDAIVLDLGLPKLDGISVARRLRRAGVPTPILMLTARGSWMERVEGIDAGADDYLPKPFHAEELMARLGAILRRSAARHPSHVLEAGAIRVDTRRMSVTLDGNGVELSPLEYRLLRYLVHNKGRMVSQVELEEHIYSSEQEPDSNAIEALVKRIRRKIGAEAIVTRRGYGYIVEG
ncbi:response regulator transcription factor [Alsobacter sp. R-9]